MQNKSFIYKSTSICCISNNQFSESFKNWSVILIKNCLIFEKWKSAQLFDCINMYYWSYDCMYVCRFMREPLRSNVWLFRGRCWPRHAKPELLPWQPFCDCDIFIFYSDYWYNIEKPLLWFDRELCGLVTLLHSELCGCNRNQKNPKKNPKKLFVTMSSKLCNLSFFNYLFYRKFKFCQPKYTYWLLD